MKYCLSRCRHLMDSFFLGRWTPQICTFYSITWKSLLGTTFLSDLTPVLDLGLTVMKFLQWQWKTVNDLYQEVFIIVNYVSFHIDPASPPHNVETVVVSSTSILVRWNDVPPIDQNGIITDYEVLYLPLETFGGTINIQIVNTSNMSFLLDDLEEYVNYTIQVRAFTSVGPGPFSDPIINQTLQDGKCL